MILKEIFLRVAVYLRGMRLDQPIVNDFFLSGLRHVYNYHSRPSGKTPACNIYLAFYFSFVVHCSGRGSGPASALQSELS